MIILQREPGSTSGQAAPVEWSTASVSSEQLSLELHQVEREIGMRTREMAMVNKIAQTEPRSFTKQQSDVLKLIDTGRMMAGLQGSKCLKYYINDP